MACHNYVLLYFYKQLLVHIGIIYVNTRWFSRLYILLFAVIVLLVILLHGYIFDKFFYYKKVPSNNVEPLINKHPVLVCISKD